MTLYNLNNIRYNAANVIPNGIPCINVRLGYAGLAGNLRES